MSEQTGCDKANERARQVRDQMPRKVVPALGKGPSDDEQELTNLGLLGKGIVDTFYSVQDAVNQMEWHIEDLERERDMLRGLLTDEQQKVAYPGPEEWIKENEEGVARMDWQRACQQVSDILAGRTKQRDEARAELRKLRAASITTLVKCAKCENGVRPRYLIHGLCDECARSEISWLRHCIESWKREEKDWNAEEKRLREIEMAVRECPTATTRLGGVKALVYTTQLRDALGAK